MEVFAAMLQENDVMRIYYMSDFTNHPDPRSRIPNTARIEISGKQSASGVKEIHNTVTYSWGTPFNPVIKAYADLKDADVDDKWLVVLTDGKFEGDVDVDGFYAQKESDIKIIHLAIGDDVDTIRGDPGRHIYFEHARNSGEILGRITAICNRIFNRNSPDRRFWNETRRELNIDVPMLELLVLAQGANVSVNGITGTDMHEPIETVNVMFSSNATLRPLNGPGPVKVSSELAGVVATFLDIPKGKYNVDITNAQTIEIYYKPAVSVAIKLYQWWGKEIKLQKTSEGTYEIPEGREGRYRIKYGLVDNSGQFINSSLIGNVEYEAILQNAGRTINVKSGNIINIKQGELALSVQGHFLDINTAENSLTGTVKFTWCGFLMNYWPIFALLLTFLIWLLWFSPLKKRFPSSKLMARKPKITKESDGENRKCRDGKFTIYPITKWLPLIAERGSIRFLPDTQLRPLSVKAGANNSIIVTNANFFTEEKLKSIKLYIDGAPIIEGTEKNMEISCNSTIQTIFPGKDGNPEVKFICLLERIKRR